MLYDFFCGIMKYAMVLLFVFLWNGILYVIFVPLGVVGTLIAVYFVLGHIFHDIKYYFRD